MAELLPLSAVIPTRNRVRALSRTLQSLAEQSAQPTEILLIDASDDNDTRAAVEEHGKTVRGGSAILWRKAAEVGAAAQRNAGMALAKQPFVLFCDDDVLFEPECMTRLWEAIGADTSLGGVSAMIVNQKYHAPGMISRFMFALMNGTAADTFAGKVIGPAVHLLPEDRDEMPESVPVDWMNLGCTIYRREALPNPPFLTRFGVYSLMEDLALSLEVAKKWKLANVRTARIFHDSQPGHYKSDPRILSYMELVNRHHVMVQILGRRSTTDYLKLIAWEIFSTATGCVQRPGLTRALEIVRGKYAAVREIRRSKRRALRR